MNFLFVFVAHRRTSVSKVINAPEAVYELALSCCDNPLAEHQDCNPSC